MTPRHLILPATILMTVLWPVLSMAVPVSGKQRLDAFLHDLNTLSARFEQSILDTENGRAGRFQGDLYLNRPGKFRWDYTEPDTKQILADGDTVYIIDDELEQITYISQERALKGTPAAILLDDGTLEQRFEIIDIGESQGMNWVELIPREEDSQFIRILLAFLGDDLRRLEMTDKLGQITRFQFYDVQRNPELDKNMFVFKRRQGFDFLEDI